jgi:hypothetical protein
MKRSFEKLSHHKIKKNIILTGGGLGDLSFSTTSSENKRITFKAKEGATRG